MKKYEVEVSFSLSIDASDKEDAIAQVITALDSMLPSDGYILGKTLFPENMIDSVKEVGGDEGSDVYTGTDGKLRFSMDFIHGDAVILTAEQVSGVWGDKDAR